MFFRAVFRASVCLFALVGCSDPSDPAPAAPDGGTAAAQEAAAAPAANVSVEYKSDAVIVNVAGLPRQDYRGTSVVSLSKLWEEAKVGADLASVEFDFEGDDGFRPSTRDRCKTKISGTQLAKGYVIPETRTLLWDDSLGLPGCYGVKGVAKVLVTDK